MKDTREEWYDAAEKVAVTVVDVTGAALALARWHLCGPTSVGFIGTRLRRIRSVRHAKLTTI